MNSMSSTRRLKLMVVVGMMLWLMPSGLLAGTPLLLLEEMNNPRQYTPTRFWWGNNLLPIFVLYDDGLVLFRTALESKELRSTQLTRAAVEEWIGLIEQSKFWELQESYRLNNRMEEERVSLIKYRHEGVIKRIAVWGPIRENIYRSRAPQKYVELFDRMVSFAPTQSKVWEPLRVEVEILPLNSSGKPRAWPKGWPGLTDSSTKKSFRDSYRLYIDGKKIKKLERFVASLKENQAVAIGGRP